MIFTCNVCPICLSFVEKNFGVRLHGYTVAYYLATSSQIPSKYFCDKRWGNASVKRVIFKCKFQTYVSN